ncbi:MAG: stage II sporulation protein D [Oscillospiraceae bacterium]|jgi:stage II sporulation protein D|nr:stage II sporulation protein D [Oscillospiraceae bacterium]
MKISNFVKILFIALFFAFLISFFVNSKFFNKFLKFNNTKTESKEKKFEIEKDDSFRVFDKSSNEILDISKKDFLIGVLAAEMPAIFEDEALKAQVVASHTYFINLKENQKKHPDEKLKGADFEIDSKNHINYITLDELKKKWGNSFDTHYEKFKKIVDLVGNIVILNEGQPIVAVYHALSSGSTEKSSDVFLEDKPYLVPVPSPWDKLDSNYQSCVVLEEEEIKTKIQKEIPDVNLPSEKKEWFKIKESSDSGLIKKVSIGNKEIRGSKIREFFNLKSPCFSVDYEDGKFVFVTKGHGHLAGMSQCGAQSMAKDGCNFKEILSHYFRGTTIMELT